MLSTFIKVPFVIRIFILSIFEWPFCTGFTVAEMVLFQNIYKIVKHIKFYLNIIYRPTSFYSNY